jgi:hypothetical protein
MEWGGNNAVSSQLTECPFCKKSLVDKSSGWQRFDNTKDLLAYIATEYGQDAVLSGKYFSDHADATLPQWQKNLVKQAFDCGAIKILQGNITADQKNREIAVKQAVQKLVDTYRSSKEDTEQIVWEFTNALSWELPEPKVSNTQPPIPQPSAPLPIVAPMPQPVGDIGKLMKRAWQFAEDGDWGDAADYFNKVLDDSTDYAPAFLGLLCVDFKVSAENKLAHVKTPDFITNHKHYKRAVSDPATKSRLDGYIQTIKDRIKAEQDTAAAEAERKRKLAEEAARKKRVQDVFDNACKLMKSAQTPDDYRKAITAFGNIDSNYQDINNQIKSKIAECERLKHDMETALDKALAPLRAKFDPKARAEKQAKLQEKRKADEAALQATNAKEKSDIEAKYAQQQQQYNVDYKAWQDEVNRLQGIYISQQNDWEADVIKTNAQSEAWRVQGLCPHDGGTLKGLLAKKCSTCGKAPNESLALPSAPPQPRYPAEPPKPQMPTFTPRKLDESQYIVQEESFSQGGQKMRVTIDGIDWLVLDVKDGKVLIFSEKVLEERAYNTEDKAITWEQCTLRKYLNNEFYNKLGTAKAAIATTNNQNPNNQWYGISGGNSTTDKVFLLSLEEVDYYFGNSRDYKNERRKKYDNGKYISSNDGYYISNNFDNSRTAHNMNKEACWWWLRSPGDISSRAAGVGGDGGVSIDGIIVSHGNGGGVRPALWLNL